ncbi:MAG: tetratricopeptide repeat protein [Leptolyngbya sp. SIO4C1]|nr:tetratricopeptide repeat protein [Leptolyngbya sp. SIO4C1]
MPIAFIIFNRPQATRKVLERIRQVRPRRLLVIADGPRVDRPEDLERCRTTRRLMEQIDWDCEVSTNYSDDNLGCKKRIETGLDWVFEQTEAAIIVEDDCLPDPTFFPFCQHLLAQYSADKRVMQVGGHNPLFQWQFEHQSYHFCYLNSSPHGWATWRRAWSQYRQPITWNTPKNLAYLEQTILDPRRRDRSYQFYDRIFSSPDMEDEWIYQWSFVKLSLRGLSIVPAVNLVTHIGAGAEATHIKDKTPLMPQSPIPFPLVDPPRVEVDLAFEQEIGQTRPETLQPLLENLVSLGQNIHALVLSEELRSQYPQSAVPYYWKAQALVGLQQSQRAIATLQQLLSLNPDHEAAQALLQTLWH